jgi:hypothetical protein
MEAYRPRSLDATYMTPEGDPIALGEVIGVRDSEYGHVEISVGIRQVLLALKPRDQKILLLRLACELTQDEIAGHIGLSQMQVSRILSQRRRGLNHLLWSGRERMIGPYRDTTQAVLHGDFDGTAVGKVCSLRRRSVDPAHQRILIEHAKRARRCPRGRSEPRHGRGAERAAR